MGTDPKEQPAQQGGARLRETQRRLQQTVRRVQDLAGAAAATVEAAAATVDRVVEVKQREVTIHNRAAALQEQASELQARLGHPERAAQARAYANHARELSRQAAVELAEYQARIAAATKAGKPRRGSP